MISYMKNRILILICFLILSVVFCSKSFAGIIELQAAIIDRDFDKAEQIAKDMLTDKLDNNTYNSVSGF